MRQGLRCELPRMSRNGGVPWRDAGLHVPAKVCFSRRPVVSLALGNAPLILLVLSRWVDEADFVGAEVKIVSTIESGFDPKPDASRDCRPRKSGPPVESVVGN
jgi:hypothetical protein